MLEENLARILSEMKSIGVEKIKSKHTKAIFLKVFLFYTFNLIFTTVLSQRDSPVGNSSCFSPGKASYDRMALPNLPCMMGVPVFP